MQMACPIFNVQEIEFLYSQNKYETYTMNEHTDRIKRIGNPRGSYKKIQINKRRKIRTRHHPNFPLEKHQIF